MLAWAESLLVLSFQVEDLNAKWQRYDASRDEYVKGLHAQLKRRQVPLEPELMKKEISRLNRQLEEKISDCAEAKQELTAVKMARDTALERVEMLEQQVSSGSEQHRQGCLPVCTPQAVAVVLGQPRLNVWWN